MALTMKLKASRTVCVDKRRQRGLTLIEFMIAITVGMIMMVGLTLVLVFSMQSRAELEKNSRQLENGRFAIQSLKEDIELAGFFGEYSPPASATWTTPDPCTTVMQDMGFAASGYRWNAGGTVVPVAIQGIVDSATSPTCVTNRKAGSDILVVRRLSTVAIKIDADGNGVADANVDTNGDGVTDAAFSDLGKGYYMQQSDCTDTPVEPSFVFDHETARFALHRVKPVVSGAVSSCLNGGLNAVRRYIQRIYYISTCDICSPSDGIPTLKMVEVIPASGICANGTSTACGSTVTTALAEGIENMQLEYGLDTGGSGGSPDSFTSAPAASDWSNVVAVKVFLLTRNNEISPDYRDTKIYSLNSAGGPTGTPFNDKYRRHVYSATVRAVNISGRRQE